MKLNQIFLIYVIFCNFAFAETERMNMPLSGRFLKDYCTLKVRSSSVTGTVDVNAASVVYNPYDVSGNKYYPMVHNSTLWEVFCSKGSYDLYLQTEDYVGFRDEGSNLVLAGYGYWKSGGKRSEGWLTSSDRLSLLNVGSDGLSRMAIFNIENFVSPIDGDVSNLPESFAGVVPLVITFEKRN